MRVVVTVCTRERPQMLRACLESLTTQNVPPGISLALIVVENDSVTRCAKLVSQLNERSPVPITYAFEPRLGIPVARNRALAIALELQPDWIAFIDDDETAAPEWIANFVETSKTLQCDVLQGPVESVYPEAPPSWMKIPVRKHQPTGLELRTAATSNTFMRARLACPKGLALRFNEGMRFTGGSDNEYFFRAADLGARICWSNETPVYENVPRIRLTLRWQLYRSLRVAANTVAIQESRLGRKSAAAKCIPKYLARLLRGLMVTPVVAPIAVLPWAAGKRLFVSGLGDLASGIGGLGAYFGLQPQPYRIVDGTPWSWFNSIRLAQRAARVKSRNTQYVAGSRRGPR